MKKIVREIRNLPHTTLRGPALKVAGIYFVLSVVWILTTDTFLERLFPDPHKLTLFQIIKGWFFVTVSSVIIYLLVKNEIRKKNRIIHTINQSEQWYNSLVSNLPNTLVFLVDESLTFILLQGQEAEKFGLDGKGYVGQKLYQIPSIDLPARQIFVGYIERAFQGERVLAEIQVRDQWYELRASPVPVPEGKPYFVAGALINITQQKANFRTLQEALRKAEESEKIKNSFLENISHEVRTPLNAIMGFSELICTSSIEEEKRWKFYQHIKESGNQLLSMIDDLLHISDLEKGTIRLHKTEFALDEMLERLAEYYRLQLVREGKPVSVRYHPPHGSSVILFSEKTRLMQILSNLLNNAIKFTDSGFVEFGYYPEHYNSVLFFVHDSGTGIEPSEQTLIFERFRKGKSPNDQLYRGTGLGLSIAKELVKMLEGQIWLLSKPNQGSCFQFRIPAHIVKTTRTGTTELHDHGRILVADFLDSGNLSLIREVLQPYNAQIILATSEKELLNISGRKETIDLILVMHRPEENRIALLLHQLRKEHSSCPVAVATHPHQKEIKELCFAAGASEYLILPFIREELDFLYRKYVHFYWALSAPKD